MVSISVEESVKPGQTSENQPAIRKVLLLSLPAVTEIGDDYLSDRHSFHLGLAYLAAILRQHNFTVKIVDCFAEDNLHIRPPKEAAWQEIGLANQDIIAAIRDFAPDLIGMTIPFSCQHYVAMEVAQLIKTTFEDVILVAGGNHVTAVAQTMDRTLFDYVVIGEGDYSFLELIQALNNHQPTDAIPGVLAKDSSSYLPPRFIENLNDLPFPAIDLLPLEKLWAYDRRWIIMVATRGCVYDCVFCSIHTIMGRRIRRRSVDNVIAEIKQWKEMYDIEEIYFEDDNLTANKRWAKELFRQIAAGHFGLRLYARNGIRADTVDKEMLLLMKAAGFQDFMIAPESGSQKTLDEIICKKMKLEDCEQAVRLAREVNLGVNAFFVIGFPEETWADIEATINYAHYLKQLGCAGFWISLASPYPGTRFFEQCRARGLITEDFDYRRCRTVDYQILNPYYSAAELKAFRQKTMRDLSPPPPTLARQMRNGLLLLAKDPAHFLTKLRYKMRAMMS
jgi:magnesium-protoporphyrin IX monomethyl ester (oxidative) cyclase